LCDSKTFYPLQGQPYVGKEGRSPEVGLAQRVVLDLSKPFYNTNRNITCDNYFTSLALAQTLRINGLTIVGTVRKNKAFIPPAMLPHSSRPVESTVFAFQKHFTLASYVPAKNRAVILLSSMHHTNDVVTELKQKPEIIAFYNDTKGAVDSLDQLVHRSMVKRRTNRWPFAFFMNMLDVIGVAAFIIWTLQHPDWQGTKKMKRRLFLVELSKQLMEPYVQQRASNPKLPKMTRNAIELAGFSLKIFRVRVNAALAPPAKRTRCHMCPWSDCRKQKQVCSQCSSNVCNEHSTKSILCNNCLL
jgi:hypothetical protein